VGKMAKRLNKNTKSLIFAALFTAVICVFSQIAIPTPVLPVTLQVFGVCLCGYILRAKFSTLSVLCYILLGSVGLPVFYGFQGGAHHLLSLTGGFIFGFLPLSFCCGIFSNSKSKLLKILFGVLGVLICHLIGVLQFSFISSNGFFESLIIASLPYLLKDIPLCVLAFYIAEFIKRKGVL
jgi:biotin transport system substrate-specific component